MKLRVLAPSGQAVWTGLVEFDQRPSRLEETGQNWSGCQENTAGQIQGQMLELGPVASNHGGQRWRETEGGSCNPRLLLQLLQLCISLFYMLESQITFQNGVPLLKT